MKIELWSLGKTQFAFIQEGVDLFAKRINRYNAFECREFKLSKGQRHNPDSEAAFVLSRVKANDTLILLDENGRSLDSVAFANRLNNYLISGRKRIIFLIGGAYGFSQAIYNRADEQISLSPMTYSHQLIRLIFTEQLYRAFSILRNEPYHNA